jgi:hypothetical protein
MNRGLRAEKTPVNEIIEDGLTEREWELDFFKAQREATQALMSQDIDRRMRSVKNAPSTCSDENLVEHLAWELSRPEVLKDPSC